MSSTSLREVDLLILGAGWTSTFLIPLLQNLRISHAATSTTGRDNTIKFVFDPESEDFSAYRDLPTARTVLITFPLKGEGQSKKITHLYWKAHAPTTTNWIQLGSTGIFPGDGWNDQNSDYDKTAPRAVAEDELIGLGGVVLNLAGLYGGTREPINWVSRVAKTKEQLKAKGALHLIHGDDVARAVVGLHNNYAPGDRWIVTDRHVYDWWELVDAWGEDLAQNWKGEGPAPDYRKWVQECMDEENVRALPRGPEALGRLLDSREFWKYVKILPMRKMPR